MRNHLYRLSIAFSILAILGFTITPVRQSYGGRFGDREGAFDQVTLLSPSGGEKFNAESTQRISWQSTRKVEYVKIEYSVNDGKDWIVIAKSEKNDPPTDSYRWKVPCNPTDKAKVRISDVFGVSSDTNWKAFSIICEGKPPEKSDAGS
jgi:hypothetical protein